MSSGIARIRPQVYLYILIILVILTHAVQLIQKTQTITKSDQFEHRVVWQGGQACWIHAFPVTFSLPHCQAYAPGSVLQISLKKSNKKNDESIHYIVDVLSPRRMEVTEVVAVETGLFSSLWWASSLTFAAFQLRELIVLPFEVLTPEDKGLARKLFLGSVEKLSQQKENQIKDLGISHIFAVSGSHVSLFFIFALNAAGGFSRVAKFQIAIGVALLVLILAGGAGSVVRAVMMMLIAQWARKNGRSITAIRLLTVTLLLTLCIKIEWLWDIGWQLSFLAMYAIVWVKPQVDSTIKKMFSIIITSKNKKMEKNKNTIRPITVIFGTNSSSAIKRSITESFESGYLSLVVTLVLLPVLWWHFDQVSLAGILVMTLGWWIFPLVFSSILIGLLIGQAQTIGLINQSLTQLISVIFFQIPLSLLTAVTDLSQTLSFLIIDTEKQKLTFIASYSAVFVVLALATFRLRGRTTAFSGSPLLSAAHGLYY